MPADTSAQDDAHLKNIVRDMVKKQCVYDDFDEGEALGEGAYGKVWIGTRYDDGEKFAIKSIAGGDPNSMAREVKVMLEANHPNLIKMHAVYQEFEDDDLHLVMDIVEPLPGLAQSDLFEYVINRGCLTTEQNCKLLYQTASALAYLNEFENCIHRDLKPENILLGVELFDRIRVTDYGLARIFMGGLGAENRQATANVGSDGYQAPETMISKSTSVSRSASGKAMVMYSKQVDIWSLGVIMYICCAQKPPFGLGGAARLKDITAGKYAPMTGPKWAKVPPELKDLVKRMLVLDPERRITVDEILANDFVKRHAGVPTDEAAMEAALEANLEFVRTASKGGK